MSKLKNRLVTRVTTLTELKQLLAEIILNNTSKISKISDHSVFNAFVYGIAKVGQKQVKDVAIIESQVFPELASGEYLDRAAMVYAGLQRGVSTGSSTFVRVKADPGTIYIPGVHMFISSMGINFEITDYIVVGGQGFAYIPVRSIALGKRANVYPQTINTVSPAPIGHSSCTNEYMAVGGRDEEEDEVFKMRIASYPNLVAKQTIAQLLEVLRKHNPNTLRIISAGYESGKMNLCLVQENGASFNKFELDSLLMKVKDNLAITDAGSMGKMLSVEFNNVIWKYLDLDFRVKLSNTLPVSEIRKNIQVNLTKFMDFRFWKQGDHVSWVDLLAIIKSTNGVTYLPDESFTPKGTIFTNINELPRIRGFIMRDIDGNIIFDAGNDLSPVFYTK